MASKTKKRKPLELEVSDFGPIARAKIELRPLTVFVGPSNTGKSYLAILIYALHKFFSAYSRFGSYRRVAGSAGRMPRAYRSARRYASPRPLGLGRQIQEWAYNTLGNGAMNEHSEVLIPHEIEYLIWGLITGSNGEELIHVIEDIFGASRLDLNRHGNSSTANILIHNQTRHQITFRMQGNSSFNFPNGVPLEYNSEKMSEAMRMLAWSVEDIPDPDGLLIGITQIEEAVYPDSIPQFITPLDAHAYYLPADRTGIMRAHQVVVTSLIRGAAYATFRNESPLGTLPGILADFLEQLIEINGAVVRANSVTKLAGNIEKSLLSGAIEFEKSVVNYPSFSYQPAGWERNLPLMNTSSMVSELAPVVLYLRHVVQPGNTLIIEEPEAHLHPGMQREFTRQIAGMIRAGIRVIITTHSEWVLEELANLVYLSSLPAEQAKKIDESAPALTPDQVGVWLFEPKKRPRGSVAREIPLDRETGTFESGFAEVSRALYNTWADIASHDQESRP